MLTLVIWLIPVVIFLLFAVCHKSGKQTEVDSVEAAILIHKNRLTDIKKQFESDEIDQEEFDGLTAEVEKALLADTEKQASIAKDSGQLPWLWVPSIALIVFASAIWLYQQVGAADAVNVRTQFRQLATQEQLDQASVNETLSSYQALLEKDVSNIEGWFRLARMQLDMGSYDQAVVSLTNVLTQLRLIDRNAEDEATILTYLGQAYTALNQIDNALAAFEEALQFAAQNTTALGMAGRINYEQGNYQQAIEHWTHLKLAGISAENADVVDSYIDQAKAALAELGIDYDQEQPLRVFVNVQLPAAWEGLPQEASLFIYARPVGQRMPIAAKRLNVSSRQITATLSDSDAMGPAGVLSGYEQVEITARVSMNGTANTSAGDWAGDVVVVDLDSKEVTLDINVSQP